MKANAQRPRYMGLDPGLQNLSDSHHWSHLGHVSNSANTLRRPGASFADFQNSTRQALKAKQSLPRGRKSGHTAILIAQVPDDLNPLLTLLLVLGKGVKALGIWRGV